ncbi:histone-lysine N-methyltransferase SETMAR-like [Mercenaria mercenaria]|uniref:histone-lysine N-methyltransferase SETMAR-like n=1 Tax=Mercenaria mercenaria TaxID=6596 RepID=UPI001E1DDB03|nr:histone-lysine N-methyltransferase SETMAR-like [Mercenaria mercenaria]
MKTFENLKEFGPAVVYKWHKRFENGRKSIEDDRREGMPSIVVPSVQEKVRGIIREDRRKTLRQIASELDISPSTAHGILTKELGMSKFSAGWVPKLLTDKEKQTRARSSAAFLERYAAGGDEFLDRIVTTDEIWLHHYNPETKAQSSVWKTPRTPPPKKARVQRSCGKEMFIFFLDRYGMILQHRVKDGRTVNADYYATGSRQCSEEETAGFGPGSGNPAPWTNSTQLEIALLGFELLEHPPYSPDLAPMDFRTFPEIKNSLRGQRFQDVTDLTLATRRKVSQLDTDWYRETFTKWIARHRKCVALHGDYVEKVRRSLDLDYA